MNKVTLIGLLVAVGVAEVTAATQLQVKWTINTSSIIPGKTFGAGHQGCQTVWDIDSDSANEIVFGTRRGDSKRLWCFDANRKLEWIYPPIDQDGLPGDPTSKISLVDVNGDGTYELCLAGRGGRLHVIDGHGQVVWTWDNPNTGMGADMIGAPQALDVDGDGFAEFFLEDLAGDMHKVSHDGRLVWTSSQCRKGNTGHPTIADIDRDGEYEVLWASLDCSLYCVSAATGNLKWKFNTGSNMEEGHVIVADVNRDGGYEAVAWTDFAGSVPGTVYCISFFGTEVWRWSLPTAANIRICQAIGDVDGDGNMDMAVNAGDGEYMLDISGAQPKLKWKMNATDMSAKGVLPLGAICAEWSSYQLIADIDGDDKLEVLWLLPYPVVTDAATGALEAYYTNPNLALSARQENGGWWGDVDKDGKSEWIVELNGKSHPQTLVYCLTMDGKFPADSWWPENSHSAYPADYQAKQSWLRLKGAYSNSLWFPMDESFWTTLLFPWGILFLARGRRRQSLSSWWSLVKLTWHDGRVA